MIKPPITYLPCFNRVLIKFVPDEDSIIQLPDGSTNVNGKIICQSIGPDVKCCKPGDILHLIPNANMIGMDQPLGLAIIHDTSIIAIEQEAPFLS